MAAIFGGWQFWLEKKGLINQSLTPFFLLLLLHFTLFSFWKGISPSRKKTFLFIKYIYIFHL
jgi:hypothetical protein